MPHVFLYVHDLRSSGVVRNAIVLARRLALDHPTTLVAGYAQGFFGKEAAAGPGVSLKVLASVAGLMPRVVAAIRLRTWLRSQPSGVMLSMGNLGHPTVLLACRGLDHVRRVYRISNEVRRDDGLRSALRRRSMALLMRDATRLVLVGAALGRLPLFRRPLETGLAVTIANGIDPDRARALASAPAPHPWLQDERVPVVLGIGRLRPQKNFDLLIEGVSRARALARRRMRLVIIGGGSSQERVRLTALAAAAGLGDDFLLAGETDNVFAWLARAAVFVLSSRWEGSSLALIEALAVGTPVVASVTAGDAAVVLEDGRYGRLFDGHDAEVLGRAIMAQFSDSVVRPGARGAHYGSSVETYARMIEEVLAADSRGEATFGKAVAIS